LPQLLLLLLAVLAPAVLQGHTAAPQVYLRQRGCLQQQQLQQQQQQQVLASLTHQPTRAQLA
jgi:hypothetical protein